jgi:hypothetical protein
MDIVCHIVTGFCALFFAIFVGSMAGDQVDTAAAAERAVAPLLLKVTHACFRDHERSGRR